MPIDASTVAASTTRNDLIRAAASASRSQRTFGSQVLGQGARSQVFSFKSALDRVTLSPEAQAQVAGDAPTAGAPAPQAKPATLTGQAGALSISSQSTEFKGPRTNPALSATIDAPTYTKPAPTLPPVVSDDHAEEEVEVEKKADPFKTHEDLGGQEIRRSDEPEHAEKQELPFSVVQQQLLSAFGAIDGEDDDHGGDDDHDDYNAAIDFDEDGSIGLNDLNTLLFSQSQAAATPTPAPAPEQASSFAAVQEQLMSSFGALEGDEAYNADLDFDGDGMIGLNDLNTLMFQQG